MIMLVCVEGSEDGEGWKVESEGGRLRVVGWKVEGSEGGEGWKVESEGGRLRVVRVEG